MVGDSFTNKVMIRDSKIYSKDIYRELKGLKNLYKHKEIFLQINIDFPADFWNDIAWNRVSKNFATVAKVAKDLNLTGIVFDDEAYNDNAHKMSNFKFSTKEEIIKESKRWEVKGVQPSWVDKKGYRNPNYNFKEHMAKVTDRFKDIMRSMGEVYPNLTLLVYNGASFAHPNSNRRDIIVTDVGLPREHEYKGAIFIGFKEGLTDNNISLYDMGESYRYRTDKHFKRAYQWRKYDIALDSSNQLDSSYQWIVPKKDRTSWSDDVNVGFMVFNKGQESNYKEYDTTNKSTLKDIEATVKKALQYSDKYVVYYCQDQDWLLPNQEHPLKKGWLEMMRELN